MGIQGKKNVPITSRVNSGLFNKNKGITEPLLNVGPAGVSGNNKTRDIPSPSKMRGYAKRSPLKQQAISEITTKLTEDKAEDKKKNKEVESIKAGSVYTPPTFTKEGDAAYEAKTPEQRAAQDASYIKNNTKTVSNNPKVQTITAGLTNTRIPKKSTSTETVVNHTTSDSNDALGSREVREQSRSIKKSGRDIRRSKIKQAKIKAKGGGYMDGNGEYQASEKLKGKERRTAVKDARNKAKVEENAMESDAFNKNMKARTRQAETSSKSGKAYQGAERAMTEDEITRGNTAIQGKAQTDRAQGKKYQDGTTTTTITKGGRNPLNVSGVTAEELAGQVSDVNEGIRGYQKSKELKAPVQKRGYAMKKAMYK